DVDLVLEGQGAHVAVALPRGGRREQLDDRRGEVAERLAHGLRTLEQEQPGLGAGAALGELGDGTDAGRAGGLEHGRSLEGTGETERAPPRRETPVLRIS